jgi:Streptomyces sporulation and cell division protein, SsgA
MIEWRPCRGSATLPVTPSDPIGPAPTVTETVSCEIVLGDGEPWRDHLPVLRLSWAESDPLAVVVVVGARPAHPALLRGRWVVLRDALRAVLGPGGDTPGAGRTAGHVSMSRTAEHVTLTLRAASLPCVVTVPAGPLRSFLTETDGMVPPGQEPWAPALDAEIARMLRRD